MIDYKHIISAYRYSIKEGSDMKKVKEALTKISKSKLVTALALTVITAAQISNQVCIVFIWGQEDMPEELL